MVDLKAIINQKVDKPFARPVGSAPPQADYVLDSYLMHLHQCRCSACGVLHEYPEVWSVQVVPSKPNFRRLQPAGTILPGLAIALVRVQSTVPVCQECVGTGEGNHLTSYDPATWQQTLQRKYAPEPAPKVVSIGRKVPSAEDLA